MKSKLSKQVVLRKNWLISHEIADEGQVALFDSESSELVLLNEFGGLVWNQIDGKRDILSIAEALAALPLDVPPIPEIVDQVKVFVDELLVKGAVSIV